MRYTILLILLIVASCNSTPRTELESDQPTKSEKESEARDNAILQKYDDALSFENIIRKSTPHFSYEIEDLIINQEKLIMVKAVVLDIEWKSDTVYIMHTLSRIRVGRSVKLYASYVCGKSIIDKLSKEEITDSRFTPSVYLLVEFNSIKKVAFQIAKDIEDAPLSDNAKNPAYVVNLGLEPSRDFMGKGEVHFAEPIIYK